MKIKKNGKVISLTESDLQRIVKKVIKESIYPSMEMPSDFDHSSDDEMSAFWRREEENKRNMDPNDFSGTYSWYDPSGDEHPYGGRYDSDSGYWGENNNPDYSEDWEDFEFDDFTELKRSDIPNERFRKLRTRKDFDKLRNPETGKVHIRKNPNLVRRYYGGRE